MASGLVRMTRSANVSPVYIPPAVPDPAIAPSTAFCSVVPSTSRLGSTCASAVSTNSVGKPSSINSCLPSEIVTEVPSAIFFCNQSNALAVVLVESLPKNAFSKSLPPSPKLASVTVALISPALCASSMAAALASSSDIPTDKYVASASLYALSAAPPNDSPRSSAEDVPIPMRNCACLDSSLPIASKIALEPVIVPFDASSHGISWIISLPIISATNCSGAS